MKCCHPCQCDGSCEPKEKLFDPSKPVQTRDGRKARVLCADRAFFHAGINYPVLALVQENKALNSESVGSYTYEGRLLSPTRTESSDLVNIRIKVKRWRVTLAPRTYSRVLFNYYEDSARAIKMHTQINGQLGEYVRAIELVYVYEDELP